MAGCAAGSSTSVQVPQQDLEALKRTNPEIQIVDMGVPAIPFIYWQLDQPPFNDPRVRQAISMAYQSRRADQDHLQRPRQLEQLHPVGALRVVARPAQRRAGTDVEVLQARSGRSQEAARRSRAIPNGFKVDLIEHAGLRPGLGPGGRADAPGPQGDRHRRHDQDAGVRRLPGTTFQGKFPRAKTSWSSAWRRRSPSRTTSCSTCTTRRGRAITPASTTRS